MRAMTTPGLQVRRATVDDLSTLIPLWQEDSFPSEELEKRIKEFQVVVDPDGEVLGAAALSIAGSEGLLHSEVFARPEQSDYMRAALWERFQILANNFGLVRVWTQFDTPFWHTNGFREPGADVIERLPAVFGSPAAGWIYLQLREDAAPALTFDKEFALFRETEKEQTEKLFRQARVLKMIAAVLGVGVFVLVIVWSIAFMKAQSHLRQQRSSSLPQVEFRV